MYVCRVSQTTQDIEWKEEQQQSKSVAQKRHLRDLLNQIKHCPTFGTSVGVLHSHTEMVLIGAPEQHHALRMVSLQFQSVFYHWNVCFWVG